MGLPFEGRQLPRLRDLDGAVEVLGLEQLRPEPLGVQADRLDLDPAATSLGGQHLDRLGPVRAFEGGSVRQQGQKFLGVHGGFLDGAASKSPDDTRVMASLQTR